MNVAVKQVATRYPIAVYFIATYLFSWLTWVPAALAATRSGFAPSGGLLALAGLGAFGPSLVGVWMTTLTGGREGLRELWGRVKNWRLGMRWYGFALLAVPAMLLLASGLQLLSGRSLMPIAQAPLYSRMEGLPLWLMPLIGFVPYLLGGALNEEFGWRGFALTQLLKRLCPFSSSAILGLLWAFWHLPLLYIPGASNVGAAWPAFFVALVPLTILFTYLHINTGGSLLLAILLHNMINLSSDGLPLKITDWPAVAVLSLVAAVIVGRNWRPWFTLPRRAGADSEAA